MRSVIGGALAVGVCLSLLPSADAQTCCKKGVPKFWKGYNKGVKWVESLETAKQIARKKGKLIMVHQLVGDMNKEGC